MSELLGRWFFRNPRRYKILKTYFFYFLIKMQFLVTEIKFDFNDDLDPIYSIPKEDQDLIVRDNIGVWEADDEDDLVEEVTANAGWCILSIDYEIQLK